MRASAHSAVIVALYLSLTVAARAENTLPPDVLKTVAAGRKTVANFFGQAFPKPFHIVVLKSRSEMDRYFKDRWGMEKTERWMVASGVADTLAMLSPDVWATDAVEHDGKDRKHVAEIITHELVHVYHGQFNPSHEFDGMDDLGWFVEGLATYASGQLRNSHIAPASEAIRLGLKPKSLSSVWSGKYRYGVSGSLVAYVDSRWGRKTLVSLLRCTRPEHVMSRLGTTENDLLASWKLSVEQSSGTGHILEQSGGKLNVTLSSWD